MGLSVWQILIVVLVIVLLFGGNKISSLAGDVAKGIKTFKKGMSEDDEPKAVDAAHKEINVTPAANTSAAESDKDKASKA